MEPNCCNCEGIVNGLPCEYWYWECLLLEKHQHKFIPTSVNQVQVCGVGLAGHVAQVCKDFKPWDYSAALGGGKA